MSEGVLLTDAARLRAAPRAVALALPGGRAHQDEGRGATKGHF